MARLSTGERQRLALARLLLNDPRVLLLDEPTSGLDVESARIVEELIAERRKNGTIVVLVSHDPAQIARASDRHLRMRDGRVSEAAA